MSRSKVKVTGDTKKCDILFGSRLLGRGPRAALLAGAATPVGKSVHAV